MTQAQRSARSAVTVGISCGGTRSQRWRKRRCLVVRDGHGRGDEKVARAASWRLRVSVARVTASPCVWTRGLSSGKPDDAVQRGLSGASATSTRRTKSRRSLSRHHGSYDRHGDGGDIPVVGWHRRVVTFVAEPPRCGSCFRAQLLLVHGWTSVCGSQLVDGAAASRPRWLCQHLIVERRRGT